MASPLNIKTEGLFTMDLHSPVEWSPPSSSSSPSKIAIPRACFPQYSEVPVAKIVRDSRKFEQPSYTFDFGKPDPFVQTSIAQGDHTAPQASSTPSDNGDISPPSPSDTDKRIPRPPNAFMLFRSHFLKEGHIPKNVEKRQQNLSRVAGEVWGLMSVEAKDVWHRKAAEAQRNHKVKYPNYKFIPSPRGSRRNKDKVHTVSDTVTTAQERTQQLREKYTKYMGPSPVSSRKRRPKKDRNVSTPSPFHSLHYSLPNTPLCTPPHSPSKVMDVPQSLESLFCQTGQHHVLRRPSTSLGFNEHNSDQHSSDSGASADAKWFTGTRFLNFVSARNQENLANPQSIDASSTWTMDHNMIGSSQQSPLHHQIAGPFPPPPANTSSSAFDIMPQQSNAGGQIKDIFPVAISGDVNNDQLYDPAFFPPVDFNLDMFSLHFVDNPVALSSDNQDSQNFFDSEKWSDFSLISQPNDSGFHFD